MMKHPSKQPKPTANHPKQSESDHSKIETQPEKKNVVKATKIGKESLLELLVDRTLTIFSGLDLYNFELEDIPKLWNPFLQKVGIAGFVGSSDGGKSTFLRQLTLAIALDKKEFLGFPIQTESNKVIYVSTEDDQNSISYGIKKQIEKMAIPKEELELLKNIDFIFETDNLPIILKKLLKAEHRDLIIIDSFSDVFTKEINANTQVRQFLIPFDKLAKKHKCLIIFLHHIGKSSFYKSPNKNSIIGTQAFEAKMRVVLELRPKYKDISQTDLWVLKSNFLSSEHKASGYKLEFKDLVFTNTGERTETYTPKNSPHTIPKKTTKKPTKKDNPKIIKKVISLKKEQLSDRAIEKKLKGTPLAVSKSVINQICNANIEQITS